MGKTACSEKIIQDIIKNTGSKVYDVFILDAKTKGNSLILLVKVVSGIPTSSEIHEDILIYEWSFTNTSISTGILNINRIVKLTSQIINDVSMIKIACVFPSENSGFVIIDREGDYHAVFLYDLSQGAICEEFGTPIYGCGTQIYKNLPENLSTITIILKDGIGQIQEDFDENKKLRGINLLLEGNIEETKEKNVIEHGYEEPEGDLEKILVKYAKARGKEIVKNQIINMVKTWDETKLVELADQLVERSLDRESRIRAAPIMLKEEILKDKDKGLILYQLKYIQQTMFCLVDLLYRAGLALNPHLIQVYFKALECAERAVGASELRRLQNEYLIKSRDQNNEMSDPLVAIMFTKAISAGIEAILCERSITEEILQKEGVTGADVFYSKLRKIEEIANGLADYYEQNFANKNDDNMFRTMEIINSVCIYFFNSIQEFRTENLGFYLLESCPYQLELWTANIQLLETIFTKNISRSIQITQSPMCHNKEKLVEQAIELGAILLREMGYNIKWRHEVDNTEYGVQAKELKRKILDITSEINPEKTLEYAISYFDFEKVVELCELMQRYDKLYELVETWKQYNFLEIAFQWYINHYQDLNVLRSPKFKLFDIFEAKYPVELEKFLKLKYKKLLWLFYIRQKRNIDAGPELYQCSEVEQKYSALHVFYVD